MYDGKSNIKKLLPSLVSNAHYKYVRYKRWTFFPNLTKDECAPIPSTSVQVLILREDGEIFLGSVEKQWSCIFSLHFPYKTHVIHYDPFVRKDQSSEKTGN